MQEFDLINQAFRRKMPFIHRNTRLANGDDASVHVMPSGHELVVSTDLSVAGVHWPNDFPLRDAACRAVNTALSDLAAMGATACWVWCSVMAVDSDAVQLIGQGVADALHDRSVELAGGDTVQAKANSLSVTVAGMLPEGSAMRRDAACVGDDVWLCGELGLAARGLCNWQQGRRSPEEIESFQVVKPLLHEGVALRKAGVRCCIDVSDGLLADAAHVAAASGLAIEIDVETLPGLAWLSGMSSSENALQLLLSGGEDYALLFTASADLRGVLGGLGSRIGRCVAGAGVRALKDGKEASLSAKGYEHFA